MFVYFTKRIKRIYNMTLEEYFAPIEHDSERREARLKFAQKIDASESSIYAWISGNRKPSPKYARRIEKETKGKVTKEILRPDIWGDRS